MGKSLTEKILEAHLVTGKMQAGEEIFIRVDQTLTHPSGPGRGGSSVI